MCERCQVTCRVRMMRAEPTPDCSPHRGRPRLGPPTSLPQPSLPARQSVAARRDTRHTDAPGASLPARDDTLTATWTARLDTSWLCLPGPIVTTGHASAPGTWVTSRSGLEVAARGRLRRVTGWHREP